MALKVGELYASFGIDASELDKALSGIEQKCSNLASSMTKTGAVMSAAITAPLVKVGKEIYEAGTSFYSQMSRVEAISGANATQMEALTAKAIEMGSTTSFTATEAGKALEYMAMAGWKSDEMLAGLAPIMDLAAASGEELAATSDIVTDALTAFGLTANDAAMFSDVLAAAATNSNTNVGMMGETFKYVAPVAGALGYTIQDTAVAIGLMANSGIKGSQAGTALRNVLTNMAKPTDTVQAAMDKLGVSLTDASGSVIPLNQVLTTLRSSFSQLSEAEKTQYATMLAGKYGMSGLLAIVNATDEEFQSLTDSINDAEGATSRMAATILDNAQGDVTIFKSAIEGLEITLWGLVDGPFRSIVQTATKWVDSFREMDSATQVAVLKVGALAAAIGPALIMGGRVVKIVGKLIPLMHALASPVGIITGALALFAVAAVDANNDIGKSFVSMSKKVGGSLKKVNAEIQGKMQTVSKRMPALCASIVEGVQNIVPEFMDTALLAVTGMMDTISDNASNIAEIGKTIITSILGGISKNLPSLISSGAKMMTSIASALIRNIPTLVQSVAQIAAAIWNGLKNTNWVALGKEILAAIGDALSGLVDLFKGWFEQATLLSGESAKNLLAGMTTIATTIINGIASAIPTLTSMAGSIVTAIGSLLAGIDWANAVDCATTIGKALLDAIVVGIKGLGNLAVNIVEALGTVLDGINWGDLTVSLDGFASMLVNGITKGIAACADAATDIISALGDVFGGIDWNDFGEYAKSIGSVLIDGIVAGIKAVLDGATKIVSALGEMLKKIDWAELGSTAADLALSLVDGIVEGLKTVDFADFLAAIGSGIKAAGEGLGDAAGAIVNKLVTAVLDGDNWVKLIELGGKLVEGIAVGIYNLGKGILEGAWGFVKGTLKGLFEGLGFEFVEWSDETEAVLNSTAAIINAEGEEITTSLQNMLANLSTLDWAGGMNSESLANAMQVWKLVVENGTDEMIAAYQEFAFLGCEEITTAFQILCDETASASERAAAMIALNDLGLGDFVNASFASCDTEIVEAARRMSENGVTTFEEAFALLGITIPEAVQAGIDSGMPLVEAAAAAAAEVAGTANDKAKAEAAASETGTAVTDKLSSSVEDGTPTVETSATSLSDAAQLAIDTLPDAAAITGEEATTGMADAIDDGAATVTNSMDVLASDVVEAALKEMSYTTGYKTGNEYTKAMKNGIADMKEAIKNTADSAARAAVSAASSVLTNSAGSSIGYNFAQGIANGIRAGSSVIRAAARSAAQSALSAAKSSLGIHSPSTVAEREIGWMWDAGLAKGVLGKVQLIEKAAGDVTDSLHDSFLVGDPSRGTVYTSGDTIRQTAKQTAEASNEKQSLYEKAEAIGRVIADRLIESGALDGDVIMDGDKVGEKVSNPVSKTISKKSRQTVAGRSAQGVIA